MERALVTLIVSAQAQPSVMSESIIFADHNDNRHRTLGTDLLQHIHAADFGSIGSRRNKIAGFLPEFAEPLPRHWR